MNDKEHSVKRRVTNKLESDKSEKKVLSDASVLSTLKNNDSNSNSVNEIDNPSKQKKGRQTSKMVDEADYEIDKNIVDENVQETNKVDEIVEAIEQEKPVAPVKEDISEEIAKLANDEIRVNNKRKAGEKRKKKPDKNAKIFYLLTQTILCAVLFFTIGMIGNKLYSYISEQANNQQLQNEFGISFAADNSASKNNNVTNKPVPEYPLETPPRYTYPEGITLAQIQALEEQNSDLVCWLHIPSEEIEPISYPVLQAKDNDFYLYKNFKKEYARSGSLFLDFRNDAETLSGHSIIYGHNMSDGSMFGNLLKYYQAKDGSFLRKHPYVYTYSLSGVGIWKVFSVYETTTDEDYIKTYFATEQDYFKFIKDLQNKSYFETDVLLKASDDVLTLSTCYKFNAENGRLIVNAVRVGNSILN